MSNVYLAMAMPVDESKAVFCTKIGETKEAAKEAVLDYLEDYHPYVSHQVEWDENVVQQDKWQFVLKEKTLHG
jgi:hypothetical protein